MTICVTSSLFLSGSEVGLLYEFLDIDNYTSPLYGRARDEVVLSRFSREDSARFLEMGFSEAGLQAPKEVVEEAVEALNGHTGVASTLRLQSCAEQEI
jgi:AAA+ ATPase superfamily predicted ATPase